MTRGFYEVENFNHVLKQWSMHSVIYTLNFRIILNAEQREDMAMKLKTPNTWCNIRQWLYGFVVITER